MPAKTGLSSCGEGNRREQSALDHFPGTESWLTCSILDDKYLLRQTPMQLHLAPSPAGPGAAVQAGADPTFMLLADALPHPLWVLGDSGEVLYVNRRARSDLAWCEAPLPHDPVAHLVHADDLAALRNARDGAENSGASFELQLRLRGADGQYRWYQLHSEPGNPGGPFRRTETATNINDRLLAEHQFRALEREWEQTFDAECLSAWQWNAESDQMTLTSRLVRLLGLDPGQSQFSRDEFLGRVHPADRGLLRTQLEDMIHDRSCSCLSFRVEAGDGPPRQLAGYAEPLRDGEGPWRRLLGVCWQQPNGCGAMNPGPSGLCCFRNVLDSIFAFVGLMDPSGTLLWANRAPLEAAGLIDSDVIGKKVWDTYWWTHDAEVRNHLKLVCQRAAEKGISTRYDVDVQMAGGRLMTIDFMIAPMLDHEGRVTHLVPSAVDVTSRKEAERKLRASQERLTLAQRAGGVGVFDWDLHTNTIVWTSELERMFGYENGSFEGAFEGWASRVHPEDLTRLNSLFRDWLDSDRDQARWEYRILRPDGSERWIEGRGQVIRDRQGRAWRMLGTNLDITARRVSELALQDSEAKARLSLAEIEAVYRTAPVGLCVLDSELRFLRINERLAEINGLPVESHLGRTVAEVLPELWPALEGPMRRVLETGEPALGLEIHGQTPARPGVDRVWVESWYPLRSAEGQIVGINIVAEEITERKEAEEALRASEARFRELADSMPQIVWTASADGRLDYCNRRWSQFTGLPTSEGVDNHWWELIHPDDLNRTKAAWAETVKHGIAYQIVHRLRRADGAYPWLLTRAVAVHDPSGRPSRWYGTATDIDEQKGVEAALHEADRRKDEFLAMLAHELRNPLAAVRNAAGLLFQPSLAADRREWAVGVIDRQVTHLARLLEDLLDVARLLRGKITLRRQRLDAAELLARAVDLARPLAESKKQSLSLSIQRRPLLIEADPTRIEQVLQNLLANAVKYTDPGGSIELSAAREGDHVVLRVADNGVGIEDSLLPHLFELFTQAEQSIDRAEGGLGIGLHLVRKLVELHGGTVSATSAGPGKGSEFSVKLPAARPLGELGGSVDSEDPSGEWPGRMPRTRVLVVDDNVDTAQSLCWLLEASGYQTRAAYDGLTALREAVNFAPRVVLLDLGLPRLDGYEVASRLRRDPATSDMILVAVSGYGREEDRRRSCDSGFDHHLVKPVALDTLLSLLSGLSTP